MAGQAPCVLDAVDIVPSGRAGVLSRVDSGSLWSPLVAGNVVVDGNAWGLDGYQGSFSGSLEIYSDSLGRLWFESKLNLSSVLLKAWQVVAYPELSYGVKPWTPGTVAPMSRQLELPVELSKLPRVVALVDYAVLSSSTAYNFAFDIWVLRGSSARAPREGDVEVMIWLHKEGIDFSPGAGKNVGAVRTQALVDGKLVELSFDAWVQERIGGGWAYVAFVLRGSKPRGEIGLDISFLVRKALELLGLSQEGYYVFSIELGYELFYRPQVDFQAVVSKYKFVVSEEAGVEVLPAFTNRSKFLIAWVTPWGYLFDGESFSGDFIPGVVVAYDVDCGLCTGSLESWLDRSLKYVEALREKSGVVFVNLFPEKYHPSWKWRGELTRVALNEIVLSELKKIIGDGDGVYIGFSELTACVNDQGCRSELVDAYRALRGEFPLARLYYYGSGGDRVEAVVALYREAGLDLVGLDVWDYEYRSGRVAIARHLAEKLRELAEQVPNGSLMVGEVGFRLNDREAYVEAWNWQRPIVYDEGADATYYRQVVEHLASLGLRPAFLGVWAWNDGVFAIQKDFEVQKAIVEAAQGAGLQPRVVCKERSGAAAVLAVIAAAPALAVAALLLLFKVRRRKQKKLRLN
ncbi:MAG: hypothetical protein QXW88_05275 [Thermofilum sp.]